jgi:hypothetical protein
MNAVAQQNITTNYPPISESASDLLSDLPARLQAETFDLATRRDALLAACARVPAITDDAISGRVADFVKQMTEHLKAATDWKDAAKAPVLKLDRAIMAEHGTLTKSIEDAKRGILSRQTSYLVEKEAKERAAREEQERIAREVAAEAERQAQAAAAEVKTEADLAAAIAAEEAAAQALVAVDAAEAAAQAKPSELARVTGALGTTSSLRKEWVFLPETINVAKIDLEALRPYLTGDDLHKAIRAAIRAGRHEIKGVTITEKWKAR